MIRLSYETILEKISSSKSISKEEIELKVKEKLVELQDLISKEGAAHIIANEMGVNLFEMQSKDLKIGEVVAGLNSVNTAGKVTNIFEVRSFSTQSRTGRVANIMVADETGSIRLTLWDENLINKIQNLKELDTVLIKNAYSKENNGFKELHLGSKSSLEINPPGIIIENIKVSAMKLMEKKQIKDLKDNESAEILATIVQLFEPRFYQACPICNKKVNFMEDHYECGQHGNVPPKQVPILNMFIDDGTANMRAVCFREQAEKILGQNPENFDVIKSQTMGKQLILKGRTTRNTMFDRTEFTIIDIQEPNPKEILKEMESI